MGARVFEWYKTIHANPDLETPYDCFNFVLACLKGVQPDERKQVMVNAEYGFAQAQNPTSLKAGKGYVAVPTISSKPTHGIVAVDNKNVLHVTGGDLVYSTAMAALAMYPGELQTIRYMDGVARKVIADYEWVRPAAEA